MDEGDLKYLLDSYIDASVNYRGIKLKLSEALLAGFNGWSLLSNNQLTSKRIAVKKDCNSADELDELINRYVGDYGFDLTRGGFLEKELDYCPGSKIIIMCGKGKNPSLKLFAPIDAPGLINYLL
jgi:hypothetical protein